MLIICAKPKMATLTF